MPSTDTPSREASPAMAPSMASRWSPCESIVPPRSPPVPRTAKPSSLASMSAPRPRRPSTTVAIRSDSLTRSSPAPRTTVSPSAKQPSSATSGSSSIASGTSSASTVVPRSGPCATSRSLTGSPGEKPPSGSSSPPIRAPIRSAIRRKPVRVQLTLTSRSTTHEPGTSSAAATKKAAEERSPGTSTASSSSGATGCVETRDQQARLHLRARDRRGVLDSLQRAAVDRERGEAVLARLDAGAHQPQGLDHAAHRPGADRVVPVERPAVPGLRREPAGHQPNECPGVADVDRLRPLPCTAQADPVDDDLLALLLNHRAEL